MRALLRCCLCVLLLAWGPLHAEPAYVTRELGPGQARLAGQGVFTWYGLTIYSAELWVGPQGYTPAAPFVLELRYARSLDGRKIAEASAEQMAKTGPGSEAQRAAWLDKMKAIFPDVKDGSRLAGVFLPGQGARFYQDGKELALVADPAFAQAFFGIWLDPATTAGKLRAQLLRDAGPLPMSALKP